MKLYINYDPSVTNKKKTPQKMYKWLRNLHFLKHVKYQKILRKV